MLPGMEEVVYVGGRQHEITKKELKCVALARYTNLPAFPVSFLVSD